MYRSTKKEKAYLNRTPELFCYFCKPEPKVVIKKFKDFYIMKNNFPYDFWDGQDVLEHLMMVTKKHTAYLVEKSGLLLKQHSKIMNSYNKLGYDIFIRTSGSPSRSQAHFHTHLIKASGKKFKRLKYNFKPYSLEVK